MSIPSVKFALTLCTSKQAETKCSLMTRATAIGVGVIALLTAVFILYGILGLAPLGNVAGWGLASAGAVFLVLGLCLKCVQSKQQGGIREAYSLDKVIGRVAYARAQGIKTALFLGRRNDQSMPKEKEWAWFSLDEKMAPHHCDSHLQLDFNDKPALERLNFLFDKVVVDWSVIKFFKSAPWDNLHSLLSKEKTSTLIVEATPRSHTIKNIEEARINACEATLETPLKEELQWLKEEEQCFEGWKERVGGEQATHERSQFMQANPGEREVDFMRFILKREGLAPQKADHLPQFLEATSKYLSQLFHHVVISDTPYPYQGERSPKKHWVLRHPKSISR